MTVEEQAEGRRLWQLLMRHFRRLGERDGYLFDHPADPDFDALNAAARTSARRYGETAAQIAEWVAGPEWEPRVRVLAGKALAGLEEWTE